MRSSELGVCRRLKVLASDDSGTVMSNQYELGPQMKAWQYQAGHWRLGLSCPQLRAQKGMLLRRRCQFTTQDHVKAQHSVFDAGLSLVSILCSRSIQLSHMRP